MIFFSQENNNSDEFKDDKGINNISLALFGENKEKEPNSDSAIADSSCSPSSFFAVKETTAGMLIFI